MKHDLKVGQELYLVPNIGNPFYDKIVKIGNKWAYVGDGRRERRISIEDMMIEGSGFGPTWGGSVYLDESSYFDALALSNEWAELSGRLRNLYSLPKGMTVDKIRKIQELLDDQT